MLSMYHYLMGKNVLVTGGAGYIGAHTCKELSKNGFNPIVIDNLSTGHKDFVKWGPLFIGDIQDKKDLQEVFSRYEIQNVIHFAAKSFVNESISEPSQYFNHNISGTTSLLDEFLANKGNVFIFSSTCAVYGEQSLNTISEECPLEPINPYGFTKLASEKLISYLKLSNNFNFSILRYFNAAGADTDLEIGELHKNETHVVPLLIKSLLNNLPFTIFGSDYGTPDGTAIRDYVHVADLARAHVLALKYNLSQKKDVICNLGTGLGVSVLDLVSEVKKIDPNFEYFISNRRSGDSSRLVADPTLAKKILGWEPVDSQISQIIKSALNWHKSIL